MFDDGLFAFFEVIDELGNGFELVAKLVGELRLLVFPAIAARLGGRLGSGLCVLEGAVFLPVVVSARVFGDLTAGFEDEEGGNGVFEEFAVVADEQEGAVELEDALFEQLEGFGVEVVGRLVENEEIGWLGEEAGEQEAVSLSAGEGFDGGSGAVGGEEKVL